MNSDSQKIERTAEQYVRGIVNMDLSDEVIANILSDRQIQPDSLVSNLDLKTKMLLKADVYMACSSLTPIHHLHGIRSLIFFGKL